MRSDLQLHPWSVTASGDQWADEFFESIFFLGNGRMGVRGYLPMEPECRPIQKGLYLAGIFGEIKPGITDFVNLPTPVYDGIFLDGVPGKLSSPIERCLDLKEATFTAKFSLSANGKRADVIYSRFFPKQNPALILQRLVITPCEDAEITVVSGIMAESCNSPIPDDQTKENTETIQLSVPQKAAVSSNGIVASFRIRGTGLSVEEDILFHSRKFSLSGEKDTCAVYKAVGEAGQTLILDKAAAVLTSRDVDPRIAPIPTAWDYNAMLAAHREAWQETWQKCDLEIPSLDGELQTGLRFSMFGLMGSCSANDPTVSIGARGLSHGRYKGCYFWDTDLFMLPFFLENDIQAAKSLCDYRVRALPAAKEHSRKMNTAGARYPWMAALDGSEQCETWDIGCSELHITADVAYALDAYCQASGDRQFYLDKAAEVYVETARFWVSRYTYRPEAGRVDLLFCKGPDEYCGITNNNLFTNVMVQHNLSLAIQAAADLYAERPEKYQALRLSTGETAHMAALRDAIPWPHDPLTGHLAQDETLHLLESVDPAVLKPNAGASYHHVCFDRLQRYKVIKQADVLLLMTRFPQLFTEEGKKTAWDDFEPICLHDSTLSFASHALFAIQNGITEQGMNYLRKALLLDLRDIMGNTGHEGLHLACMGEAWQAAECLAQAMLG